MKITLCVYTDGRGEYLVRTIESMTERVAYLFDDALMVDDSGNAEYAAWLDHMFPSFRHIHHASRIGFAGAIRSAWSHLPKCDFVYSLEDDFVCNDDIDIARMSRVLIVNPELAQLVLKRQPWNSAEKESGGIVELHPTWYTERETEGMWISEHNAFFSTNPNLMRYELTRINAGRDIGYPAWPNESESEGKFGASLRAQGYTFAFLGKKFDAPLVTHIGEKRVGSGY